MSHRWFALVVTLMALGCDEPPPTGPDAPAIVPDGIDFEVSQDAAEWGDTVTVTLVNATTEVVGYNLCFASMERWDGSNWRSVRKSPNPQACPAILYELPPDDYATYPQVIHDIFGRGSYRFRSDIEWLGDGESAEVVSAPFEVSR